MERMLLYIIMDLNFFFLICECVLCDDEDFIEKYFN